jgi:hypothetical protein
MSPEECRYLHIFERSQNFTKKVSQFTIFYVRRQQRWAVRKKVSQIANLQIVELQFFLDCGLSVNVTICRFSICGPNLSCGLKFPQIHIALIKICIIKDFCRTNLRPIFRWFCHERAKKGLNGSSFLFYGEKFADLPLADWHTLVICSFVI